MEKRRTRKAITKPFAFPVNAIKNSYNNRRMKCLMFKLMYKTPLFIKKKIALQAKLALL